MVHERHVQQTVESFSLLVFYVTCNDISVIYVDGTMCRRAEENGIREDTGGLSREYVLRIPSVS